MEYVWVKPGEPWPKVNVPVIVDEFTEMFPMWLCGVLVTAESEKWAQTAAGVATGFATSIIGAPLEASLECAVPKDRTPDGRPGVVVQMYHLADVPADVNRAIAKGKKVLLEGTQGTFLSVIHGTYPYGTSRDTTASAIASECGVGPKNVDEVILVFKPIIYLGKIGYASN